MEKETKEIIKIFLKNKKAEVWVGIKFLCLCVGCLVGLVLIVVFAVWLDKSFKNTFCIINYFLSILIGISIVAAIICWIVINWAKANLEYLELTEHKLDK